MFLVRADKKLLGKITSTLLFLLIFAIDAVFRIRAYEDKSIDFQVIIKLLILIGCFAIGCLSLKYKVVYKRCLPIFILLLMFLFSAFYSPNMFYSIYLSFTFIAVFLFLLHCFLTLGFERIIVVSTKALFVFTLTSIVLYVFFPDVGRFAYWDNDVFFTSSRMSGLAGSANNFARIMAIYFVLVFFYRTMLMKVFSRKLMTIQLIMCLSCLVLSGSRTTILALIVCLFIYYFSRLSKENRALAVMIAIPTITLAYFIFPYISIYFSRHDGADLTSLTGRTFIWDISINLVKEKLLLGHGIGSSVLLLPAYIQEIGFKASHAHNMYLQTMLSIGLVGLVYFLFILISSFVLLVKHKNFGMISVLILVVFIGYLESAAISLTANIFTVFLFLSIAAARMQNFKQV